MLKNTPAFSGFSVNSLQIAKEFYNKTLGIEVAEDDISITLKLFGGNNVFVYEKEDHQPATYTVLNFVVDNIDSVVNELTNKGIKFEHYTGDMATDDKGILRGLSANMGPDIAWFKDPAGNILSVLQDK